MDKVHKHHFVASVWKRYEGRSMHYEKCYGLTLFEILKQSKDTFGDKILFSYMKDNKIINISYNRFWKDVQNIANRLDCCQLKGKYVAIEGKSEYEMIVAFYAVISIGAIAVMLNLDIAEAELVRIMNCTNPAMLIVSEDGFEAVEEYAKEKSIACILGSEVTENRSIRTWLDECDTEKEYCAELQPENPALVLMTSGSTSQSKLVLLSHYAFVPRKEFFTEKNILVFPLYHIAGIALVNTCVAHGIELCLSNMKEGIRDIEWFKPTEIVAVPAFISVIVARSKQNLLDLKHFRGITSGAAPQNMEVAQYLSEQGIFTYSTYGSTETSGPVGYITSTVNRMGSVGKPGPWNEVKLSEEGEILVKGKNVMLEYLGNSEETNAVLSDGWYHTGDVGRFDEDGYLYITGRIKNIIILSNGENVSPEAIEAQLNHCEQIEEVVVRGENDMVVAHVWCGEKDDEEVRQNVEKFIAKYNRGVPSYHRIRKTVFRDIPFEKTATGKIKR